MPLWLRALALVGSLTSFHGAAQAVDGISIEVGESTSSFTDVTVTRIGATWNWQGKWLSRGNWHLGGYWDASVGYWHVDADPAIRTTNRIIEVGLTPMMRWQPLSRQAVSPFIDLGIGIRLVDEDSVTALRNLSGPILFGSVAGVGLRFGPQGSYEVAYRFQHISNGGVKEPNNGLNLQSVRFHYAF